MLLSLSLTPSGITSQINYLHRVLFSGLAFGGAKICIYEYFLFFLGFVAQSLYLLTRDHEALCYTRLLRFASEPCIFPQLSLLEQCGFGFCLFIVMVYASGEPLYLSSCLLVSFLLFCVLGTPVILRLDYLVSNFISLSLIAFNLCFLKSVFSDYHRPLLFIFNYECSFVFLNYLVKNV